jgi:type I restriction enzyme S subunit
VGSNYPAINSSDVKRLLVPDFSWQERAIIGDILKVIDGAIERTESLVAKYQQIKAGLMHDLFTRGVTPDGKLRPPREQAPELYHRTKIGWLPKDWKVKPLRDLTIKIADRDHTTPVYLEDGVIMVSPTNLIDDEGIDFAACRKISFRDHTINRKKTDIQAGDLILHRIGAGLGAVRLVTAGMPDFSILHSMALVRPSHSIVSAEFLLWSFRTHPVRLQIDIGTQSIGVPDLGLDKIGSLMFPVAPHNEQMMIASSLRAQMEACNAERGRLIKLRQQKHGLMHDLLTGKVRTNG